MTAAQEKIEIGPQKGPQEMFLATSADIAIFGGAAGISAGEKATPFF